MTLDTDVTSLDGGNSHPLRDLFCGVSAMQLLKCSKMRSFLPNVVGVGMTADARLRSENFARITF